jgi:hypothetical protein
MPLVEIGEETCTSEGRENDKAEKVNSAKRTKKVEVEFICFLHDFL